MGAGVLKGKVGRATDAFCLPIRPGHRSLGESRRGVAWRFAVGWRGRQLGARITGAGSFLASMGTATRAFCLPI